MAKGRAHVAASGTMRNLVERVSVAGLLIWLLLTPVAEAESPPAAPAMQSPLVVLMHGLGRTRMSMWLLASRLEDAGFRVHRIGYRSLDRSPDEIVESVSRQINACCAGHQGEVHLVGHSLGGLLIRAYLEENRIPHLGRVVLIGTPNQGVELVDRFSNNCLLSLLGPTTAALGAGSDGLPERLSRPYYPVGVIAGATRGNWNDRWLDGPDDGLISVESTKLEGMADFIIVDSGHSMMRYSGDVARQTIEFLRTGRFSR